MGVGVAITGTDVQRRCCGTGQAEQLWADGVTDRPFRLQTLSFVNQVHVVVCTVSLGEVTPVNHTCHVVSAQ